MKDILPEEARGIALVQKRFEALAESYGYDMVLPSPLELLSTLETKSGPAIREEIYDFEDKGGREVGLRFDFTMGLTRHMTGSRSVRLPAKIASFGGVFRYDEPQKNRYRYFHQWDIEVYGKPHAYQDVEIIEFTARLFESLHMDVMVHLNHRQLVEEHIRHVFGDRAGAVSGDTVSDMLRAIDKMPKKPLEDITAEFADVRGYDKSAVLQVLGLAGLSGLPHQIEERLEPHIRSSEHWKYLKALVSSLEGIGVKNVKIDFGIVRGLDYYTGAVFEVFGGSGAALAGGGRYDSLPGAFGRADVGAAGVAGGVERMLAAMGQQFQNRPGVAVLYTADTHTQAARLASGLRRQGVRVRMDVSGRSLKKQMAAASGCSHTIIVGPEEAERGVVSLRDMERREQHTVPYGEILERAAEHLNP